MTRLRALAIPLALMAFVAAGPATAQEVDFSLDETMTVQETEIAYRLDLALRAVAPTRVGVEALLDLRDFQLRLPELLAGKPLVDGCGNNTAVEGVDVTARDSVVGLSGTLRTRFYRCERTSETGFRRGDLRTELGLGFSAEATTGIKDNCVVFSIGHLDLRPLRAIEAGSEDSENIAAARTLILEAVNLILAERPFCPKLPPQLASLDPVYDSAGPREIDAGGLGIALHGSVDVSTRTIIAILGVLQRNGAIPGPP